MEPQRAKPWPWRGLLLGLILIPPTSLFGVYAYIVAQATLWGQTSLLRGPIFLLFGLVLLSMALRRLRPRLGLSETDLLVFYIMGAVATAVAGLGWSQFLVPAIGSPRYYATSENALASIWQHIPNSWWVHDPQVITALYRGHSSLYEMANWLAIWRPLLQWGVFMSLMALAALCVTVLLREQWVARERLTFPLAYLPLEMARDGGNPAFWRNRLLWIGFGLVAFIDSVNALHFLIPAVPEITVKPVGPLKVDDNFTQAPWTALRPFVFSLYPFMIGIGFLLTTDVSFSCWAWYLLIKALSVVAVQFAWTDAPLRVGQFPWLPEQGVGAFLALALIAVWRSRGDIQAAFRPRRGGEETGDRQVNRWAVIGLFGSLLLLFFFIWRRGLPPWAGWGWLAIYMAYSIGCARIVSETGSGWTWSPRLTPHDVLLRLPGAPALNPRQATVFAWLMPFDIDFRDSVLPQQMKAMRLIANDGGRGRPLLWALAVASVVGVIAGLWAHFHIYFQYGIDSALTRRWPAQVGRQPFDLLANQLRGQVGTPYSPVGVLIGGGVLTALVGLRSMFMSWPLHPIGYALALTNSLDYLWMPFLVAWGIKVMVLRYGGMRLYRQLMPFFLGLILGDYVVPLLWAMYGAVTSQQMYLSFPH